MSKKSLVPVNILALASEPSGAHVGDMYFNTGDSTLYVYDGADWSATYLTAEAIADLIANASLGNTDDLAEGITNKYFSIQGVAEALNSGTLQNITFTYAQGVINASVPTVQGTTGTQGAQGAIGIGLDPISFVGATEVDTNPPLSLGDSQNFGYKADTDPWAEGQYVTFYDDNSTLTYTGRLRFQNAGGFGTAFGLYSVTNITGTASAETSSEWTMAFAAAPQGVQGETGAQGATGTQGTTGTGFGVYYLGNYNPTSGYVTDIAVVRGSDGQLYLAKASGELGDPINYLSNGQWEIWIPKGAQGPTGAQGTEGSTGTQGVQGTQGVIGETGLQGPEGAQGIQGNLGTQGIVSGATAPVNTGVLWLDTSVSAVEPTQGVQGIQGVQGSSGGGGSSSSLFPPFITGQYYRSQTSNVSVSLSHTTTNTTFYYPIYIPEGTVLTELLVRTSSSYSGTASLRLGLFNARTTGWGPNTMLVEGVVSPTASSTTYPTSVSTGTLSAGWYFTACNIITAASSNIFVSFNIPAFTTQVFSTMPLTNANFNNTFQGFSLAENATTGFGSGASAALFNSYSPLVVVRT